MILHSPEFLREATAASDATHPERTIVGIPHDTQAYRDAAQQVLAILPKAPFELVCSSREAEYIKYANNSFLYWKVLFANIFADALVQEGGDWDVVRSALAADSRIGPSHLAVSHTSCHKVAKAGRGAGGLCFIKDFAAFVDNYERVLPSDTTGLAVLRALEAKNKELLTQSGKDLDLLKGVYGDVV
jgi:UDPglucose 6-dehydrogenase